MEQVRECDVIVVGGGFGGVAAALTALEGGQKVILTEPTDWIGGQVTSQAVSALDEHRYIETFGGTRSYYNFREAVREVYRNEYGGPRVMPDGLPLNPGNGWVSKLCFEPRVGLQVLEEMLAPYARTGQLEVFLNTNPINGDIQNDRITALEIKRSTGESINVRADYYLDATELGDLLPLVHAPYISGAESIEDTGEPNASTNGPQPERVQSFTWCFVTEYRPGENHTIRKPHGYEAIRDEQPFSLTLYTREGQPRRFYMFEGDLAFWKYRRSLDAKLFSDAGDRPRARFDIALINWDSNDYYKENIIDRSPAQQARILNEARRLSLSFLYWLQTEAPCDSGTGRGYPGIRLLPEAAGTADGFAKAPYIRESRRVLGLKRVLEQDIIDAPGRGARALHYKDSVGIGFYPIDLHRCAGDPPRGQEKRIAFNPSLPFQIPLGALLSPAVENLIMAAKNIATTHITNGAYRLHPVEWNIGESAGWLAAYCRMKTVKPHQVWEDEVHLRKYQAGLLARGIPLFWSIDLGLEDPDFSIIQSILVGNSPSPDSPRYQRLQILPDEQISRSEAEWLLSLHPRANQNSKFMELTSRWRKMTYEPLAPDDFRSALASLDLAPGPVSDYPTLRQVCTNLAKSR